MIHITQHLNNLLWYHATSCDKCDRGDRGHFGLSNLSWAIWVEQFFWEWPKTCPKMDLKAKMALNGAKVTLKMAKNAFNPKMTQKIPSTVEQYSPDLPCLPVYRTLVNGLSRFTVHPDLPCIFPSPRSTVNREITVVAFRQINWLLVVLAFQYN